MILKVGLELTNRYSYGYVSSSKNIYSTNSVSLKNERADYCTFTGNKNDTKPQGSKLDNLMYGADPTVKKMLSSLKETAKKEGYATITPLQIMKYLMEETYQYIEDLDNGVKSYKTIECPSLAMAFITDYNGELISDEKLRAKAKPVIKKYLEKTNELIDKEKENNVLQEGKEPVLSEYLVDIIWSSRQKENNDISSHSVVDAILDDKEGENFKYQDALWHEMCKVIMENNKSMDERTPLTDYETKADNVLTKIKIGTNVFVTFDYTKVSPDSFIDTIQYKLEKQKDKDTKIIEFNKYTIPDYFNTIVAKARQDKKHNYIIIADPTFIFANVSDEDEDFGEFGTQREDVGNNLAKPPANVKYILYDTNNNYYKSSGNYPNYEEVSIPSLSAEQMVKAFKENPNFYKELNVTFSPAALEVLVNTSDKMEGAFPEKTVNLMKKVASYHKGKKEINEKDIDKYLKEANFILKKNNDDSSIKTIFDTKKKLKDITGKDSTLKEAQNIVKLIKSGKLGTKGVLMYSQDGYPGGGRKFTAKAIAGEAKIPYIEINAMDFGTKDVDLFGDNSLSPEKSMKKLFSVVSTQAETNKSKAAVLYIENFENFSVGEAYSSYYQKAMAQLLREMDKADESGLNILVIGSVSDPEAVGETAMKSFKFVDMMEIASTAHNKRAREQVIKQSLKDLKLKIEGTPSEQEDLISYVADLTSGFPCIYLKNLIKKAQSVAAERNHKRLNRADMTEAYLQQTTGRPSVTNIRPHEARIVASHECGHAVNLEVMNNIAKTIGKQWHIPNKVNFITLDPRGSYGGAVYDGIDNNKEVSFENIFADIVCFFGGTSAENRFYNIDGSYGITSDMECARSRAMDMVRAMGMGAKTGKMTIYDDEEPSDNLKQMLETDERVILHNAKITSDLITEVYEDFNKEFTRKYASLVGTGECIFDGNDFRRALFEWKQSQSPEKQRELKECDKVIVEIMEATKRGVEVQKTK